MIWAGIKGASITGGLRSLLSGQQPTASQVNALSSSSASGASVSGNTSSSLANAGLAYVGSGSVYKWGGGNPNGWDCSGFVNYVASHDLNMAIPGYRAGSFNGSSHGPVTSQWAIWNGAKNVPRAQVQAGDLIIWPAFHMGIAVSNTQFVNCPGPNGTPAPIVSSIDNTGIPGPRVCRRIA